MLRREEPPGGTISQLNSSVRGHWPHAVDLPAPPPGTGTDTGLRISPADTLLEHTQVALKLLSAIADGANIPILKGVVSAVSELLTVVQVRTRSLWVWSEAETLVG